MYFTESSNEMRIAFGSSGDFRSNLRGAVSILVDKNVTGDLEDRLLGWNRHCFSWNSADGVMKVCVYVSITLTCQPAWSDKLS